MTLLIEDPETEAAVRKLAADRGVSLTSAVRDAVEQELNRRRPLKERVEDIIREFERYPPTGLKADKAFFDDLSGS